MTKNDACFRWVNSQTWLYDEAIQDGGGLLLTLPFNLSMRPLQTIRPVKNTAKIQRPIHSEPIGAAN